MSAIRENETAREMPKLSDAELDVVSGGALIGQRYPGEGYRLVDGDGASLDGWRTFGKLA